VRSIEGIIEKLEEIAAKTYDEHEKTAIQNILASLVKVQGGLLGITWALETMAIVYGRKEYEEMVKNLRKIVTGRR